LESGPKRGLARLSCVLECRPEIRLHSRIAQAHKGAGAPNPVAHRDVQNVLAGIVRTKTVAQTRKDALTTERLDYKR
jgi:hypothetical protein